MPKQRMDRAAALALIKMTPAASATEVTLPVSGITVPCYAMTVEDFLGQQFARFASVREVVVGPMRAIQQAQAKGLPEGIDASDEKAIESAIGNIADDLYDPFDALGADAAEASSAAVAAAACHYGFPGDREIEDLLSQWDPEDLDFYVEKGEFRTWENDPGPFYQRVLKRAFKNRERQATLLTTQKKTETSSPATTG